MHTTNFCSLNCLGELLSLTSYPVVLIINPSSRLVRESIPQVVLGLFMHTPFPSSEVFRCLPRTFSSKPFWCSITLTWLHIGRKEILDGMLGANLVCFQVCELIFYPPFPHFVWYVARIWVFFYRPEFLTLSVPFGLLFLFPHHHHFILSSTSFFRSH